MAHELYTKRHFHPVMMKLKNNETKWIKKLFFKAEIMNVVDLQIKLNDFKVSVLALNIKNSSYLNKPMIFSNYDPFN